MMGPEGLGVFYCRAPLRGQLKLSEYGWHMVEQVGDYSRADWEPAQSARRFECGSPNLLATMALEASLSLLQEVGISEVARRIEERVQWLIDGLMAIPGMRIHSPVQPQRRAGIVCFSIDGVDSLWLQGELMKAQVVCLPRGQGIRFSPHFYTDKGTIDTAVALVRQNAMK
jgi:selenocysteine lyase/cysteine desulfurase